MGRKPGTVTKRDDKGHFVKTQGGPEPKPTPAPADQPKHTPAAAPAASHSRGFKFPDAADAFDGSLDIEIGGSDE